MRKRIVSLFLIILSLCLVIAVGTHHAASSLLGQRYAEESSSTSKVVSIPIANASSEAAISLECHEDDVGYMDSTGKLVIPMCFARAEPFSEGTAAVLKYLSVDQPPNIGYLNLKGEFLFWPLLEGPQRIGSGQFSDGLLRIRESPKGKMGYVDMSGEFVIAPQFVSARPFNEGLAGVCLEEGQCGYIDTAGEIVIPAKFEAVSAFSGGVSLVGLPGGGNIEGTPPSESFSALFGLIDRDGDYLVPPDAHKINLLEFMPNRDEREVVSSLFSEEGLAPVRVSLTEEEVAQLPQLPPDFSSHTHGITWREFADFPPTDGIDSSLGFGKWGYVRKTGGYAIEPRYWYASEFEDGLATVTIAEDDISYPEEFRGQGVIIDIDGNIVTNSLEIDRDSRYANSNLARKRFLSEDYVLRSDFTGGLAVAEARPLEQNKYGYVNAQGDFVIPPIYDFAEPFEDRSFALVKLDSEEPREFLTGLIDRQGNYILQPQVNRLEVLEYGLVSLEIEEDNGWRRVLFSPLTRKILPYYAVGSFDEAGFISVSGKVPDNFQLPQ
ncbi:MAG: WG repeat-containing protein [Cyanobacteria bacterium J06627_28]